MAQEPTPVVRQSEYRDSSSFMPLGDLRTYLTILRRRKWSVIFVVALTLAAAAAFSYRETPMYQSSATVLVKPLNPNQILQGYTYNFSIGMHTEQQLASSPEVARLAAEQAQTVGVTSPDTGQVTTSTPTDTTFLVFTYSAPSPTQAEAWAQSYALGYMEYRREQALQLYDSAVGGYQSQLDDLQSQIDEKKAALVTSSPVERESLRTQITSLSKTQADIARQAAEVPFPVSETAAQLTAPATLPAFPYAPDWRRNLLLAAFAGLVLGLSVAFVRERLDDRMTGREDLEEAAGAPVLAIVPAVSGWRKRSSTKLVARDKPRGAPSEAYRTIRTNMNFLAKTSGLSLVAIASPSMGEGKTTTTANLAVALAQSGKRVIAVSCDLRKPRLHDFFDLTNDTGMTSVLLDGMTVTQVARRVAGLDTLRLIATGPIPHNPAELLGSDEMDQLLTELRHYAEFVLLDMPPILAVSDSLVLSPKADGVVIVADAGDTHRSAIRAAREQLEQVGANIVGAIFNNFDPSKAKSYPGYYKYGYYGYSRYHDDKADDRQKRRQPSIEPENFWR